MRGVVGHDWLENPRIYYNIWRFNSCIFNQKYRFYSEIFYKPSIASQIRDNSGHNIIHFTDYVDKEILCLIGQDVLNSLDGEVKTYQSSCTQYMK